MFDLFVSNLIDNTLKKLNPWLHYATLKNNTG